jgi:hypothetical protein
MCGICSFPFSLPYNQIFTSELQSGLFCHRVHYVVVAESLFSFHFEKHFFVSLSSTCHNSAGRHWLLAAPPRDSRETNCHCKRVFIWVSSAFPVNAPFHHHYTLVYPHLLWCKAALTKQHRIISPRNKAYLQLVLRHGGSYKGRGRAARPLGPGPWPRGAQKYIFIFNFEHQIIVKL